MNKKISFHNTHFFFLIHTQQLVDSNYEDNINNLEFSYYICLLFSFVCFLFPWAEIIVKGNNNVSHNITHFQTISYRPVISMEGTCCYYHTM